MLFKIKAGNNYDPISWIMTQWFTFKPGCKFRYMISPESYYTLDGPDQSDWNKLFGLSNNWDHHDDSLRLAWRSIPGDREHYEISTYMYRNGARIISDKRIRSYGDYYEEIIYLPQKFNILYPFHLILKPWFGGSMTAPNNQKVEVTWRALKY